VLLVLDSALEVTIGTLLASNAELARGECEPIDPESRLAAGLVAQAERLRLGINRYRQILCERWSEDRPF
jgi:hypothetical protein